MSVLRRCFAVTVLSLGLLAPSLVAPPPASAAAMCWQAAYVNQIVGNGAWVFSYFGWASGTAIVGGHFNQDYDVLGGVTFYWEYGSSWKTSSSLESVYVRNTITSSRRAAGWLTTIAAC